MTTIQSNRHSQIWVWSLIALLAMFLVLVVLTRVAAKRGEPTAEPVTSYIVRSVESLSGCI